MIVVTPAEPTHVGAIVGLAEEMGRFYGATEVEHFGSRVRQVNEALFADPPAAYALLAWDTSQLVGFAAYSFLWPAIGLTRSLYLKELYVLATARRKGVGTLLMRSLFEIAVQRDCSRVEWTTDQDNDEARSFYELLGVSHDTSKIFYRLEGEELRDAVQSLPRR